MNNRTYFILMVSPWLAFVISALILLIQPYDLELMNYLLMFGLLCLFIAGMLFIFLPKK